MANNSNKSSRKNSVGILRRTNHNSEFLQKLKDHLKVLFQFDCADLDFGIYRIMNYKRKEIEKFIEDDLIGVVEKEFEKYKVQNQKELLERIDEKKKEIRKLEKELGEKILKNGEIEEKFRDKPFAKEYTELKKQIEEIDIAENIQLQVFNDLYNFFTRYYEDGDFISKRRYSSKQHKYAIPYSGEEVKLYWANFDQYYIKTGEIFKDYEFNQKDWKFIFRTVLVDVEAGNVKGNRRYFFLSSDEPAKIANKICLIKFEYRPLTNGDLKLYSVKTKDGKTKTTGIKQDELNPILRDKILNSIAPLEPKAMLNETQDEKTILEKHLHKYTRKITSDFFIHKNLKDFLERELDYFIKTEVLDIESLGTEKERYFDKHITRAIVVKNIGRRIIEFLSQIEEFQKLLWQKKKFVLKTDYVITIDRVPEEFYPEILKNKQQLKEWEDLGFGKAKTKKDLNGKKFPVDTKYFSEGFRERLLEKLSEKGSLDDLINGILIKSENWQALNLIIEKYKEEVQTIYIDPPFKTGKDFLYKDNYQDSSWLTLMRNRLNLSKDFLNTKGSIFVHLDWNANFLGRHLLGNLFPSMTEIVWNTNATKDEEAGLYSYKSFGGKYVRQHDTIFQCAKTEDFKFLKLWKPNRRTTNLQIGWLDLVSYPNKSNPQSLRDYDFYLEMYNENMTLGLKKIAIKEKIFPVGDIWNDIYSFTQSEIRTSENVSFDTQKPENLLRRIIQSTSEKEDIVMDFFAGSGTALVVAHKLRRKWIGIEMGNCFEECYVDKGEKKLGLVGRLKIVFFGDKNFVAIDKSRRSHLSKDINWSGGGFLKYHYLEQYEDTLHNIEFPQERKGQKMLELLPEEGKTEYLMKYILKFETEGSSSLLNLKQFESPFEYKLKIISNGKGEEIVNVDLVETFNYLSGMKVNKYKFLKENGRKYVFVLGERDNRKTAIIWRPIKDIDLKKDRAIIDKSLVSFNPDEIFINGDSFVKGYKPIESEFKTLAGV